jgi:CDP-diacylglycerol---glycerol-3-phosphate 3-phosphatidyltransferase
MYHTPNLTGLRKRIIPRRINEGWGLQHMKLYGVDDEIMMSGANLSDDYFTNRQDRYHLFSSKDLADYFYRIQNAVSSISFRVDPDSDNEAGYSLEWPASNSSESPLVNPNGFKSNATKILQPLIQPNQHSLASIQKKDTTVYPLAQMTQLFPPATDPSTELPTLEALLRYLSRSGSTPSSWTFTAGYFNIHPTLSSLLLETTSTNNTVITASPWANGFYGSKGVSGLLPSAYTLLSRRFLERVNRAGRASDVTLREWRRGTVGLPEGWTYHAKGLWVTLPGDKDPSVTLVGSSNYTKRSYSLDLEVGCLVVTKDESLKKKLGEEVNWLKEYTTPMGLDDFTKVDRRVSIQVRVAMWIVKILGGQL